MDSKAASSDFFRKSTRIFVVVSIYWVVSISLVFTNKALLSGSVKLDAPLFITAYQCVVTFLGCYVVLGGLPYFRKETTSIFIPVKLSQEKALKIVPLSVVFVAMITFNNLCLKNVGVSFYYIGRSLTTVFNVIFTYVILGQKTSLKAILCCALIIFGFFLGVDQEGASGTLSISGTFFGVAASFFVCMNSIYTKKILPVVDGNIWELQLYNNINACFLFAPLILIFGEIPVISSFDSLTDHKFWSMMTMGGLLGFAIGYVTGLQIQVTSPLTHNISGTAKSAAQTILAIQWNHEIKTTWWWLSNGIVLGGSALYAYVRQMEMKSNKNADPPLLKHVIEKK